MRELETVDKKEKQTVQFGGHSWQVEPEREISQVSSSAAPWPLSGGNICHGVRCAPSALCAPSQSLSLSKWRKMDGTIKDVRLAAQVVLF